MPLSKKFDSNKSYFEHLIQNHEELVDVVSKVPEFLTKQDEQGRTILHHIFCSNNKSLLPLVQKHITKKALSITDFKGDTPLHLAAKNCCQQDTYYYIFPVLLQRAVELDFNFSQLNKKGDAVLHCAYLNSYVDGYQQRYIMTRVFEKHAAGKINFNLQTSNGVYVLFLMIQACHFDEVKALLAVDANPALKIKNQQYPQGINAMELLELQIINSQKEIEKNNTQKYSGSIDINDFWAVFFETEGQKQQRYKAELEKNIQALMEIKQMIAAKFQATSKQAEKITAYQR